MFGFTGRLLYVDLSSNSSSIINLEEKVARSYLGGSGLGAYLLSTMDWSIDPLDPRSRLAFVTGPLTGTPAPLCSRYSVCARSPLTSIWGEAHASGFWGPELKSAGLDGIVIEGRAPQPVYLLIQDDAVVIRDAGHLWGKDTYATEDSLRQEPGS